MSMRSTWSGYLGFGLVQAPVKLYKATDNHDIGFKRVHEGCGGHVGNKMYCKTCGAVPEPHQMVKGIERDGQMLVISDDEIVALEGEQGKQISILQFVPAEQIDPIWYEDVYYIGAPDGAKVYALLAESMETIGVVAVAQFTMRSKTKLATIRVLEGVLVLHTLRWADELRPPEVDGLGKSYTVAELKGAKALVQSMVEDFDPYAHKDEYQERLVELIDSKAGDMEFVIQETPAAIEEVGSLLAQLEASVAAKKKPAGKKPVAKKAPAKKAPARKRSVA